MPSGSFRGPMGPAYLNSAPASRSKRKTPAKTPHGTTSQYGLGFLKEKEPLCQTYF